MPACSVLKAAGTEVKNDFLKGLATINIEHNAHGHWLINNKICYVVIWGHLESMTECLVKTQLEVSMKDLSCLPPNDAFWAVQ